MTLTPTPCSRCGSRWPQPGCYVCADSPEPTQTMNTEITINKIRALAEQLEADAQATREILILAEEGEVSPDEAAALLNDHGIAII